MARSVILEVVPLFRLTLNVDEPPTWKSASNEATALAVSVTLTRSPVKVVPLAFQVCAKSSTGADAVSVPLLAVSARLNVMPLRLNAAISVVEPADAPTPIPSVGVPAKDP